VVPFGLGLLSDLAKVDSVGHYLLAGIAAMGGVIGTWGFLGVAADGDLTQYSNGSLVVIGSAGTGGALAWNMILLVSLVFTLFAFMSALYGVYRGFR